jgi:hypothetical protein
MPDKLLKAFTAFDFANAQDPNKVSYQGREYPKELLYAQRMTEALNDFEPNASEHVQLAARAQHIERWLSPRSNYPEGRSAYKKWRSELALFHAQRAGELMMSVGYTDDDIDRVKHLVQKRQLKRDSETQLLEDVICLVFLKYYLDAFATQHEEAKLIDIIRKTWGKMSDQGHSVALKIAFTQETAKIIKKSLN